MHMQGYVFGLEELCTLTHKNDVDAFLYIRSNLKFKIQAAHQPLTSVTVVG